MAIAKCRKCGGSATADTFEQAKNLINHAVGLSRGIKCGDNYNAVQEIKSKVTMKTSKPLKQKEEPKTEEVTYSKVEGKTGDKVVFDEAKTTTSKKSKK